jgi:hypothetical protein
MENTQQLLTMALSGWLLISHIYIQQSYIAIAISIKNLW